MSNIPGSNNVGEFTKKSNTDKQDIVYLNRKIKLKTHRQANVKQMVALFLSFSFVF